MARKNNRFEVHQSIGLIGEPDPRFHQCTPLPCRNPKHVCLGCGKAVSLAV